VSDRRGDRGEARVPSERLDDVTVVVRSAGERTLAVCRRLLEEVFPADRVHVIAERPFAAAVRRTCEIGSEAGRSWTLAVDADVLVRADALRDFVTRARRAPERVFELQGRILDKPFGGPRDGGPHLYRSELLALALRFTAGEVSSARPEFHLLRCMASRGYPWLQGEDVLGIHDFEQFHRDLHRKARAHARKHRAAIPLLRTMWLRLARRDPDYRALLLGLEAGRSAGGDLGDAVDLSAEIDALLEAEGLEEKGPLGAEAVGAVQVAAAIDGFHPEPEFHAWQAWCRRERAEALRAAGRDGRLGRGARRLARAVLGGRWRW
jgi:hypothetical protein